MRSDLLGYLVTRFCRVPWIAHVHGWLGDTHKGRFNDLLRRYPLHIVTDPKVGLKGAARLLRRELRV